MNKTEKLRVSLVIPVYNEADRIAACLEAVAAQTSKPYEVIVVDNNSTDETRQVAESFAFVRLITAKRQGVVHARTKGFDAARGDIIGRIDADTRIPENWVSILQQKFTENVDAVSGSVGYYDVPYPNLFDKIDLHFRSRAARLMGDRVFLQAANMAIRRSAWRKIRRHLCAKAGIHEDFDIAIHLSERGYNVAFSPELRAEISARCLDDSLASFWRYVLLNPSTYFKHRLKTGSHMLPLVVLILLFYLPLRSIYRKHNRITGLTVRVNPATFVD